MQPDATHFRCLHLGGCSGSIGRVPLSVWGGSITIEVGECSLVSRYLMKNAWPPAVMINSYPLYNINEHNVIGNGPMLVPLPGRT